MRSILPAAAAAATGVLVGAAIVATRFVIHQTSPASLALLRYSIGFCCLLPPVLMSARVRFERRDLLPIGLLGITQFGILIALLNYALQFIPSARAALIFATFPLLAMLASVGFLAVLAAGEGFFGALPRFTVIGWMAVLFIGVSSGVGYFLWLWALGHTTPTRVTVFLALSPVTAAGLGSLLLAERVSTMSLIGLAYVALGLWLAHWQSPAGRAVARFHLGG
jgi:drug/metabolite transporter (DMT)-like permease